jgi:hypothetical protein
LRSDAANIGSSRSEKNANLERVENRVSTVHVGCACDYGATPCRRGFSYMPISSPWNNPRFAGPELRLWRYLSQAIKAIAGRTSFGGVLGATPRKMCTHVAPLRFLVPWFDLRMTKRGESELFPGKRQPRAVARSSTVPFCGGFRCALETTLRWPIIPDHKSHRLKS